VAAGPKLGLRWNKGNETFRLSRKFKIAHPIQPRPKAAANDLISNCRRARFIFVPLQCAPGNRVTPEARKGASTLAEEPPRCRLCDQEV
jgi:hypothetical protein